MMQSIVQAVAYNVRDVHETGGRRLERAGRLTPGSET
jgi:hypothetical protein